LTADSKETEVKKLRAELGELGVAAAQALELGEKVKTLETEVKTLNKETVRLTEAYNTERVRIDISITRTCFSKHGFS